MEDYGESVIVNNAGLWEVRAECCYASIKPIHTSGTIAPVQP